MTLLSICQDAATEIGFPKPSTVIGSTDNTALQLLRLVNREGEALSKYNWQSLQQETSITLATGTQTYSLPADFRYIVPSSTWNRTNKRVLIFPVTSQEWQFLKGWTQINGLNLRGRIKNSLIEIEQTITSTENGDSVYYEYISKYWTQDAASTAQQKFAADDDTSLLDEELLTLGLVWRFKKSKGLDWQPDFVEYKDQVAQAKARDKGARVLKLQGDKFGRTLGVNLPDRNYG